MLNNIKLLPYFIEREEKGLTYICPKEDKKLLRKLFREINRHTGTHFHYLAELDAYCIRGAGSIVAEYITEFSSESIKSILISQMVSDKIKDCDKLLYQLYMQFKGSDEYISKPGEPSSAGICIAYDNAFRKLKPKKIKKELVELAHNPRDAFYLPFTMRMLASWKIPEMKDILLLYAAENSFSAQDVGIYDSEKPYFPPYEWMKEQLVFTAIDGLKYYPSAEAMDVITSFTTSTNKDIRSAAEETLKVLTKEK